MPQIDMAPVDPNAPTFSTTAPAPRVPQNVPVTLPAASASEPVFSATPGVGPQMPGQQTPADLVDSEEKVDLLVQSGKLSEDAGALIKKRLPKRRTAADNLAGLQARTTRQQNKLNKEMAATAATRKELMQAQADLDVERKDIQQTWMTDENIRRQEETAKLEQQRSLVQTDVETARSQLEQARNEVRQAAIDPHRTFRGAEGLARGLVGALSVGLGAISQAILGGENRAMEMINASINRDIDVQKAELASKRQGVQLAQNRLAQNLQRFDNLEQAEAATRMQGRELAKLKLEEMLAGVESQEARVRGQTMLAELDRQQQLDQAKVIDQQTQRSMQMVTLQEKAEQKQAAQAAAGEDMERLGLKGRPASKKALDEVIAMKSSADEARKKLVALRDMTRALPFSTDEAKGEQLARATQLLYKELENLGVLSGPDLELLEQIIPTDPTGMRQEKIDAQYQQALDLLNQKTEVYLRARGVSEIGMEEPMGGAERLR